MAIGLGKLEDSKAVAKATAAERYYKELLPLLSLNIEEERHALKGGLKEKFSNYDELLKKTVLQPGCNIVKFTGKDINQANYEKTTLIMHGNHFYFSSKTVDGKTTLTRLERLDKTDIENFKSMFSSLNANTVRRAMSKEVEMITSAMKVTPRILVPVYKNKHQIKAELKDLLEQAEVSLKTNTARLEETEALNERAARLKEVHHENLNAIKIPQSAAISYKEMQAFAGALKVKLLQSDDKKETLFLKAMLEEYAPILNAKKDHASFEEEHIVYLPEEKKFAENLMNKVSEDSMEFYFYINKVLTTMEKPKDITFTAIEEAQNTELMVQLKSEVAAFEKLNLPNAENLRKLESKLQNIVEKKLNQIESLGIPISKGWKGFINTICIAIGMSEKYYHEIKLEKFSVLKNQFMKDRQKQEPQESPQKVSPP